MFLIYLGICREKNWGFLNFLKEFFGIFTVKIILTVDFQNYNFGRSEFCHVAADHRGTIFFSLKNQRSKLMDHWKSNGTN